MTSDLQDIIDSFYNNKYSQDDNLEKIILKIINSSYLFQWLKPDFLINALRRKKLIINEVLTWETIIEEWDMFCDSFFLIIKWEVSVYKWSEKIIDIDWWSIIWEIGFVIPEEWRTATVKSKSKVYMIEITKYFINTLRDNDRAFIYENLSKELAKKVMKMNEKDIWKNKSIKEIDKNVDLIRKGVMWITCIV